MFGFVGLIVLTLFLTLIFTSILFGINIIDVQNNWPDRRCEPLIMFTAPLYQKSNDKRNATNFAYENLSFCLRTLSVATMAKAFSPLFDSLKSNFKVIQVVTTLFSSMRIYLKMLLDQFTNIFEDRFSTFRTIFEQFRLGFRKLESAHERINAIMTASLFQAITGIIFLKNFVKFVIMVIFIILGILAAMMILLIFIFFPGIAIIGTTTAILMAAGLGAGAAAVEGAFCLHPETSIALADGSYKPIKEIQLGDILPPSFKTFIYPNGVYGILEVNGSKTELYDLDGVKISGTHRVFEKGEWTLVRDVERARKTNIISDKLYILNTTHHLVSAVSESGSLYVSDWEEVSTEEGQKKWIEFVSKKLGTSKPIYSPSSIPLCGKDVKVVLESGEHLPISEISIGAKVKSEEGVTTVIGIYKGYINNQTKSDEWLSDGNWIKTANGWSTFDGGVKDLDCKRFCEETMVGYQIITSSGAFNINYLGNNLVLRDFTECGTQNLEDCYSVLDDVI